MQVRDRYAVNLPESIKPTYLVPLALGDAVEIPFAVEFVSPQPNAPVERYYWLQVAFVLGDSLVSHAEGVRDIQFGVIWAREAAASITDGPSFDRTFLWSILSRQERLNLRELICQAVHWLLDRCQPETVTMSTVETGLPDKALQKFKEIAAACETAGWNCKTSYHDGDDRAHWHFMRVA